ncbi:class F sortase [Streptomyces coeruleorubidus]|uniref:class F sortase n=1 Tax=Streptomyces coeruleorubidus TaxID=116188 RepID=UPI00380E0320
MEASGTGARSPARRPRPFRRARPPPLLCRATRAPTGLPCPAAWASPRPPGRTPPGSPGTAPGRPPHTRPVLPCPAIPPAPAPTGSGRSPRGPQPPTPSRTPPAHPPARPPEPPGHPAPRPPSARCPPSRATRLLIPYLRVDAPVMDLGLDRERRLTAPPEDAPKLVGWYRQGASPGERGTAVAVGHLDTDSGPAVFAGLTEPKPGRTVKARRADGRIAVYTVDKIKSYEKARFPSQEVYGARGRPELRLITCGGSYERRKGYSGNVVVFAHLTGIR